MKLPESAAESLLQSNFYLIQLGWGEGELEVEGGGQGRLQLQLPCYISIS